MCFQPEKNIFNWIAQWLQMVSPIFIPGQGINTDTFARNQYLFQMIFVANGETVGSRS